ncbi:MAG: acyl carrier protein [Flavipsychrobacter sp.]|nr:acyl carrier protein [Flavipsychrobacter sp.]
MERIELLKSINDVFIDVLDNEDIQLTEKTSATDVEDWDSLNHIQLIVAIEKKFKIRFKSDEIRSWQNVGEMMDSIETKL